MGKTKRRKATTKPLPWNGDHGTGTFAATDGTILKPVEGDNPNRMAMRVRPLQSALWANKLSNRQWQAARAIEDAYGRAQAVSSGGDSVVKVVARVDKSPRPDAAVAGQIDATSHLVYVMSAVPAAMRDVIEHLFWHQRPMRDLAQGRAFYNRTADVKVALDLVANRLRY